MKYITRFLKLFLVTVIALFIGFPFAGFMLIFGICSLLPLMGILYIKTGNKESFDKAADIAFETLFEEVGFIPFKWCSKLVNA